MNNFPRIFLTFLMLMVLGFNGCKATDQSAAEQSPFISFTHKMAQWQYEVDHSDVPVPLFPTATVVKTFGLNIPVSIIVNDNGTVTTNMYADPIHKTVLMPTYGGNLTKSELATIRVNIRLIPDSLVSNGCACTFRHVLVFFDANGHYLGNFEVCFHCGCMIVEPLAQHKAGWDEILANEGPIKAVFAAHNLPVFVSPDRLGGDGMGPRHAYIRFRSVIS